MSELKEFIQREIEEIGTAMQELDQVECPVTHRFGPGIYIREVFMPKGTLAIGHHQNFEQMNIFVKGKVTVVDDNGELKDLEAPMTFMGPPGRKIGYIHEDVVWQNVYATNERDIETLENTYLTKSDAFTDKIAQRIGKIEAMNFREVETAKLPDGEYKFKRGIGKNGVCIIATGNYDAGEVIGPARLKGKNTIIGQFVNNTEKPNASIINGTDGDLYLVAKQFIEGCRGGFDGHEITVDNIDALKLSQNSNSSGQGE